MNKKGNTSLSNKSTKHKVKYNSLHDYVIPQIAYADKDTVLTSNGDIMQTFEIISFDNKSNIKRDLQKTLTDIFCNNLSESENYNLAFWVHDIREKNKPINNFIKEKIKNKNALLTNIYERTSENYENLYHYDTKLYITIIYSIKHEKSFKLFFNILLGLNTNRNSNIKRIQDTIKLLNKITDKALNELKKDYNVKKLSIVERKEEYYSEHLEFIANLAEGEFRPIKLPMSNLSNTLKKAKFNFDFGCMSCNINNKINYRILFTIKDNNSLDGRILNQLIGHSEKIAICEILHPISYKKVDEKYGKIIKNTKKEYETWQNYNILEDMGLSQMTDKNNKFFKQYIGIMIYGDSANQIQENAIKFLKSAKEKGVVIAQEDIGIERTFYSFIPGNFTLIKHDQITHKDDVFSFAFTYNFDNQNIYHYIAKNPIVLLSTIQKKAYAFGILKDKPNILISSLRYRYASILSNYIIAHTLLNYPLINLYMVDSLNCSKTFIEGLDGHFINASSKSKITPLSIKWSPYFTEEEYRDIIKNLLLLISRKTIEGKELDELFNGFNYAEDSIILRIQNLANKTKNTDLMLWFNKEGENSFMINEEDLSLKTQNRLSLCLDKINLKKNKSANANNVIEYLSLYNLWTYMNNNENPNLISISQPFSICENQIVYKLFKKIISVDLNSNVFIFTITEDEISEKSFLKYDEIKDNINTEIHNFDLHPNDNYQKYYGLSDIESFTLKSLYDKAYTAILKQNGITVLIDTNISPFIKTSIVEMLSDNQSTRELIEKYIKDKRFRSANQWIKGILSIEAEKEALRDINANNDEENKEDLLIKNKEKKKEIIIEKASKDLFESS